MVRAINYREIKRRFELDGAERTTRHFSTALQEKTLRPDDFSLRELAEALIPDGGAWVRELDPRSRGAATLLESEGVDLTAFSNVTGQLVNTAILDAYEQEAFVASRLVSVISTRFDGERIPGATKVRESDLEVAPGMPYPSLGFGEDYIDTPRTQKRGLIVPVTREAVFFDRTHLVLARAAEVGETLGANKEKRILDVILGLANNYRWNGAEYNTYLSSGAWVNEIAGNALDDWTNVDKAEQLLAEMSDPHTGDPIVCKATTALVMPARRHAAHRVFNGVDITYSRGSSATTAVNPLGGYQVHESRLAYRRITASGVASDAAKQWWFLGDFKKAFAYMENWPVTVTQNARHSEAEFENDIVLRFKASERGAAAVLNPRFVVKCVG